MGKERDRLMMVQLYQSAQLTGRTVEAVMEEDRALWIEWVRDAHEVSGDVRDVVAKWARERREKGS